MASYREIITVQSESGSNSDGTHSWNVQESSFIFDRATAEKDEPRLNRDVLFREGKNLNNKTTFTPKLVAAGFSDKVGRTNLSRNLYPQAGTSRKNVDNFGTPNDDTLDDEEEEEDEAALHSTGSELSDEVEEEEQVQRQKDFQVKKKRFRGPAKPWIKQKHFENDDLAAEFIKNEGCWVKNGSHVTAEGRKVEYRCNKFKRRSSLRCPASIYLLYHASGQGVTQFRLDVEHQNHDVDPRRGLSVELRSLVQELFESGVTKPKDILAAIRERTLEEPPRTRLTNYIAVWKKKKKIGSASKPISAEELEKWCNDHATPCDDDPNAAFVVSHSIGQDEDGKLNFRIFLSTPRLLEFSLKSDLLQAGVTNRLNWQCSVLAVGTSDQDRKAFPIGLGVCSGKTSADFEFVFQSVVDGVQELFCDVYSPSLLLAGHSDMFAEGFSAVFGTDYKRGISLPNVMQQVHVKLNSIKDEEQRSAIRDDIGHLQLCTSEEIFNAVVPLFFDKWERNQEDLDILEFLSYFKSEWIDQYPNWHEGYALNAPSTNHGFEAIYYGIVVDQQIALAQFLDFLKDQTLRQWSLERDPETPNCKTFAQVPTKTATLCKKAHKWAEESKAKPWFRKSQDDGSTVIFIGAEEAPVLTPAAATAYRVAFENLSWNSFDQYVEMRNSVWMIRLDEQNWEEATCTCHVFLKQNICQHSLGAAIRLGLYELPESMNPNSVEKRKRGRPKRARLDEDWTERF